MNFSQLLKLTNEVGYIEAVNGSLCHVSGLPGAKLYERVLLETGQTGYVLAAQAQFLEVLVASHQPLSTGTRVARTNEPLTTPTGTHLLGQYLNAFGQSSTNSQSDQKPIFTRPAGIRDRSKINRPLATGVQAIDLLFPLGMGQRQLLLGDHNTGKTRVAFQAMIHQALSGTIVIYTLIGKRQSEILKAQNLFTKYQVQANTILISASAAASPAEIIIAPFTAMTLAESFRDQGHDVLLVLDDLTNHAKTYRELSLLAKRFPGRDSYPGDIFYLHSRLLERAGNFRSPKKPANSTQTSAKDSSITCLAMADTEAGDLTGYIQTNLMSMTDGHLFFDTDLYAKGIRPAINPFLSVTRVGRQTQSPLFRDLATRLLKLLSDYQDAQNFSRFGAQLPPSTRQTLTLGAHATQMLNQPVSEITPTALQAILLTLVLSFNWNGHGAHKLIAAYNQDAALRQNLDQLVANSSSFSEFSKALTPISSQLLQTLT